MIAGLRHSELPELPYPLPFMRGAGCLMQSCFFVCLGIYAWERPRF